MADPKIARVKIERLLHDRGVQTTHLDDTIRIDLDGVEILLSCLKTRDQVLLRMQARVGTNCVRSTRLDEYIVDQNRRIVVGQLGWSPNGAGSKGTVWSIHVMSATYVDPADLWEMLSFLVIEVQQRRKFVAEAFTGRFRPRLP